MRIIGGQSKGKTIKTLRGRGVRPTSDLVREALFAILGPRVEGAVFLDLFAGSGAIGIEALSRGAKVAIFVDENPRCIKILKENLAQCGLEEKSKIYKTESLCFLNSSRLRSKSVDIIFVDPPYDGDLALKAINLIDKKEILTPDGRVIVEHFHKTRLPEELENIAMIRERRFGTTKLSFFSYYNRTVKTDREEE